MKEVLTTREAGDEVGRPEWFVRRIVDSLNPPVDRFGHKRMIPRERLAEIRKAIDERQQGAGS